MNPTSVESFTRNAVDLIEREDLGRRLAKGQPLRVKFGMDPSSPDLHLGHCVQLFKLRALQQAGHTIVLIVGDSTAMVGDPSGRNKLRPQLTRAEVEINLATYVSQVGKVIDMRRAEIHRNSEWFDAMRFEDVLRLASRMTVARMQERDTFQKRTAENEPIGIHEFLYPLMQGWDSVMIRADVELGGTDQLFNLIVGRHLQEQMSQPAQVVMTLPLITGLDGRKMSKSYDNSVPLTDSAREMFHKIKRVEDQQVATWFELLTEVEPAEIARLCAGDWRDAKDRLASEITRFFHGEKSLETVRDAPEIPWPDRKLESLPLANLLKDLGLSATTSEARRAVQQGGVTIDGVPVADAVLVVKQASLPILLQLGKRRAARVVPPKL
ncbi:MAG TPA: tyrosine--tRNA ligase [Planctomycetota bacterium]|nr:tyrosine--tRNA ligase [Planctomycetota bacterium]